MAPSIPDLCYEGSLEEVRDALARGEDVNHRDAEGWTGLMRAAERDHEGVVELLLQQPGLDVNLASGDWHRSTALHLACLSGHAGIVRSLLSHSSLTCHNAVDRYGSSPLMGAVFNNMVKCVLELVTVEGLDL